MIRTRILAGIRRAVTLIMLLSFCLPAARATAHQDPGYTNRFSALQQTATPAAPSEEATRASELLLSMTPEERVGQLFLVTFKGLTAEQGSEIDQLITKYHVGGVMLLRDNDNFSSANTLDNAIALTRQLQALAWESAQQSRTLPLTGVDYTPMYVPLLIGSLQEGDGYRYDQIMSGVTTLPNQMALGATWNPENAQAVGAQMGQELSALGINLLLGPSLDILEFPHTVSTTDLGTRVFGGDPFWVSELGKAYVAGLHGGSQGRLAVIAKHFPGYGASDRLPEDEVATVRRSLEQLIGFELSPFFEVTGLADSPEATVDGLLSAHIRIQGLQGNIRAPTRPISLDPQALKLLLELPQLESWRAAGGLVVSDDLGSQAMRSFYDLTSQAFDMPRRVALNALLAGNDLLYVNNFTSSDLDAFTSAQRTLEFFAQKYREDNAFAQRVDESVLRILQLKLRLFSDFQLDQVQVGETPPTSEANNQLGFDVARQAVTLISPSQEELDDIIPDPPNENDRIVFVTDARTASQCSLCAEEPLIAVRALEQAVIRLYGPQSGGQVTPANLSSFSLDELLEMLESSRGATQIERSLFRADWIVFSMLDASDQVPSYDVLSRFLTERPDLFQRKRLIVFAFNAPYFLDATNISKLTAYYALYSKSSPFIDVAAYSLFRELPPEGASPVSIPGISYSLSEALFPSADQVIPLELDIASEVITPTLSTEQPAQQPVYQVGDVLPLRAGIILDQNGNPVPDGTPVEFSLSVGVDPNPLRQAATTTGGIARTTFTIPGSGTLEIEAVSEPARSNLLIIEVPSSEGEATLEPTPLPPTPTPSPTITPTTPPLDSLTEAPPAAPKPGFGDWMMALFIAAAAAWLSYRFLANMGQYRWGARAGFLALAGGMAAYSYLVLELPGSQWLLARSIPQAVFIVALAGALSGLVIALLWRATQPYWKKS